MVGLLPGACYGQGDFQLLAGDILVCFTDGISEAMNEQDEEWEESLHPRVEGMLCSLRPADDRLDFSRRRCIYRPRRSTTI